MISRPGKLMLLIRNIPWLNIDTLDDRIIFQKTVYLLQYMRLTLGYRFNWYIHGPYSPSLADDIFTAVHNKDFFEQEAEDYAFADDPKKIISRFKKIFAEEKKDPEKLELLASIHFLNNHHKSLSQEKLYNLLLDRKEKYNSRDKAEVMKYIKLVKRELEQNN